MSKRKILDCIILFLINQISSQDTILSIIPTVNSSCRLCEHTLMDRIPVFAFINTTEKNEIIEKSKSIEILDKKVYFDKMEVFGSTNVSIVENHIPLNFTSSQLRMNQKDIGLRNLLIAQSNPSFTISNSQNPETSFSNFQNPTVSNISKNSNKYQISQFEWMIANEKLNNTCQRLIFEQTTHRFCDYRIFLYNQKVENEKKIGLKSLITFREVYENVSVFPEDNDLRCAVAKFLYEGVDHSIFKSFHPYSHFSSEAKNKIIKSNKNITQNMKRHMSINILSNPKKRNDPGILFKLLNVFYRLIYDQKLIDEYLKFFSNFVLIEKNEIFSEEFMKKKKSI